MPKRKGDAAAPWDEAKGWRAVEVGDEFLQGSDEFGFMGLEELDPRTLKGSGVSAALGADGDDQQQPSKVKGKKARKRKQPEAEDVSGGAAAKQAAGQEGEEDAPGAAGGASSVEQLQAQLKALKAENKQLKKRQRQESQQTKKKEAAAKRKSTLAAAGAAQAAAAVEAAEAAAASVDVGSWREHELHPTILGALSRMGFGAPTQVQAECLPAAVRDRRDVIGAAQTGSGKTLAFGIPIVQLLVQEREQHQQRQQQSAAGGGGEQQRGTGACAGEAGSAAAVAAGREGSGRLRALVLAPTRELALQVCEHLQVIAKPAGIWVVPIVGGISADKQERLLGRDPEVVVATPGRLWDLMNEGGHRHLTDLSALSFLVIDEADRMVQQGHYSELGNILGAIPSQRGGAAAAERGPEGAKGAGRKGGSGKAATAQEEEEEEFADEDDGTAAAEGEEQHAGEGPADAPQQQRGQQQRRPPRLQTFVFSATLTLPAALRKRLRKGGGGATGSSTLDDLMDRIPFRGKPKIVDLTSKRKLADKVEEAYISCGDAERDEMLYCLLAKHPGRTIVFVNAISSVRRLGAILKLLGLNAQPLHAGMQQRQRLRALDKFKSDDTAVLVATDVAARGLDVRDVRCVIHYQLPASVDVYVHRSGRTARAEAEGVSIALVTPKESARFVALLRAMGRDHPPQFPIDASLLAPVRQRLRLALQLDALQRKQGKAKAERSWRHQQAEKLGIQLSDDEDGGGDSDGEGAGMGARRQGKRARKDPQEGARQGNEGADERRLQAQLGALLAEPLQPKFSPRYFTGGAAAAVARLTPAGGGAGAAAGSGKRRSKGAAPGAPAPQEGGEAAAAAEAQRGAAAAINASVQLAKSVADSRSRAAADVEAGTQRQRHKEAAAKKKVRRGSAAAQDPRAAALSAALAAAVAKKQGKRGAGAGGGGGGGRKGLFVVPRAFGREAGGPDALQALRQMLGS